MDTKKLLIGSECSTVLLCLGAVLCGCAEEATPGAETPAWLASAMPEDARDVAAVKKDAREGDEVVVRGIIGGQTDAMSPEVALFVMMDSGVANPCVAEGAHCASPWDYCCTPPEQIIANNATVVVVDAHGDPVEADLREHGIDPLDTVIIVGSVGERQASEVLTIRATAIYEVGQ